MDGRESQSSTDESAPVTLPWQEPGERELKDMFASAVIALLLALTVVGALNTIRGEPGSHLGSAILSAVLAVVAVMSWYGPFGAVGLHTTVDSDGLHVRHRGWRLLPTDMKVELSARRHLPAHQIGTVELVTEEKRRRMWTKSMALAYGGRGLGWTHTIVDRDTVEAVMVEQVGADLKRPWWLLKSTDCAGLIEALELARSQATPHRA